MVTLASHALFAWPSKARSGPSRGHSQPVAAYKRPSASLRDQLDRLSLLSAKQVAAAKLETRLALTKQFNHKVALNAELRDLQKIVLEPIK